VGLRPVSLLLAAALLALGLTACTLAPSATPSGTPSASPPAGLAGTTWRLVSIQDLRPPLGPEVTLAFAASDISGNGGCNTFNGSYTIDPASGSLRIGDLGSTKRACVEPGRGDLENAYFAALRGAVAASLDSEGRLVLAGAGARLVFERAPGLG
jgi:heat shock protein HslJ